MEPGQFSGGGHEDQPAARTKELAGRLNGQIHPVDSAEGDAIKGTLEGLGSAGVDGGRKFEDPYRLLEKSCFLALRFSEGHGDLRTAKGDGDPRKTCTRAEVQQRGDSRREVVGAGDGFDEMTRKNAVLIANRGQVDASIPAKN